MRQNNFNFLRFYFAFVVVIGHIIVISEVKDFQFLAPYFSTYTSVTAFFCISGFLITQSYFNSTSVRSYFRKRAARLLPAYVLVIVLSAIFLSLLSQYSISEYFKNPQLLKYVLANLSFLNFIEPNLPGVFLQKGLSPDVNGALWTLKVEVCFYLIVPALLLLAERIKRKYLLFIGLYLLSIIYKNSLEYISQVNQNNTYAMLAHQLPGFISYFVCGIALFYYQSTFQKYKIRFLISGLVVYLLERNLELEILTPLSLSLLVFTVAFSIKQLNSFGKYGDISYGLYLFHCPIIKAATYLGYFQKYNPFFVALIVILVVVGVSLASWHWVEKGFLKRAHSSRLKTIINT